MKFLIEQECTLNNCIRVHTFNTGLNHDRQTVEFGQTDGFGQACIQTYRKINERVGLDIQSDRQRNGFGKTKSQIDGRASKKDGCFWQTYSQIDGRTGLGRHKSDRQTDRLGKLSQIDGRTDFGRYTVRLTDRSGQIYSHIDARISF
ncbi:hypothetical protein DPMN_010036 [Dreissena polymorpha]|uniref:Uncharacterized protein n=1 Tax=Dreissena polymorpha TaxID=45954 RepID=A0A9D4S0L0_DREPO|nr:hypothetical protein DPMN_010036 [Dreissena polymorpha]